MLAGLDDGVRDSEDEATFTYVTLLDSFVSQLLLNTESFPGFSITQTEFSFSVDANNTWL